MMNIFDSLKTYAGKWSVKATRKLNDAEKNSIYSVTVVDSQYGTSACFMLKTGSMSFIPMSTNATKGIGEVLDINEITIVTLEKSGEADIIRVEC